MGARLDGVSDAKAPGDPRRLAPCAARIAEIPALDFKPRLSSLRPAGARVLMQPRRSDMAFEAALGMERLCTIREIAEKAELGTATVHRALKNSREVRPETRRLVLDTVCRLNEEKIARAARFVGG